LEGVFAAQLLESRQVPETGARHAVVCDAVEINDSTQLDSVVLVGLAEPESQLFEHIRVYLC
jgi:hypothetical protein